MILVIQARMSSSRLPGKVLMKAKEKTILEWVLDSVRQSRLLDHIVVATSNDPSDDVIEKVVSSLGYSVFRGSLEDVQSRFIQATEKYGYNQFVRICADSPLIDHRIIDKAVQNFFEEDVDIMTNTQNRTYPKGCSVEVVQLAALKHSREVAFNPRVAEHVTQGIYARKEVFKIGEFHHHTNLGCENLCVDTKEDFEVFLKMADHLPTCHSDCSIDEKVKLQQLILQGGS